MAEKRSLNSEGVAYRRQHVETGSDNLYREGEGHEYNDESEDAMSREGKALGKGTGKALGRAIANHSAPKSQINYSNVDSKNGGGDYDINGRNGVGGRKRTILMNEYNSANEYGDDSVEVDPKTYKDMRLKKNN